MSPEHCKNIVNKCYSLTCVKFWRANKRKSEIYPSGYYIRFPLYKEFPVHMVIVSSDTRNSSINHIIYFNKIPSFKCKVSTNEIIFQGKVMGKAGCRFYGDVWIPDDTKAKQLLMTLFLIDKNNLQDVLDNKFFQQV